MDITDFLLQRIAEDEAAARQACIPAHDTPDAYKPHGELARWRYQIGDEIEYDYDDPFPYPQVYYVTCGDESPSVTEDVGRHIARWDPARVLAECEAKRRIIGTFTTSAAQHQCDPSELFFADEVLRALALPYADYPDFDVSWHEEN